ncbi:MAG: hypothetical protein M3Q91_02995 [Acidobacteriota bacterium]|nr:hypothetical protein [Acidobacteriota bacterium]
MKASTVTSFTKTVACPSSNILLSFHMRALSPEITTLVRHHLAACDFCCAEMPLLAHYQSPLKGECRPPEIPINLRILAESLIGKSSKLRKVSERKICVKFGLSLTTG